MQKIAIYSSFSGVIPIEERIAAIKEAGFESVCLDFEKELEATETTWANQLYLAEKYGLPVENVHLTGSDMTAVWSEGEKGEAVTERLIQELRDIASLGIEVGIAHVTWGYARPAEDMLLGLHRYEKVAEAAEKYNVKLALENSVYPAHVRFLLDNLKSEKIGFCYDSGHENAFTKGENFLNDYKERLFAMHLHDNNGQKDQHGLPFTGTIHWESVVSMLRCTSLFSECITLECIQDAKDHREWLHRAYATGQKLAMLAED